jgi:hypothetical protein
MLVNVSSMVKASQKSFAPFVFSEQHVILPPSVCGITKKWMFETGKLYSDQALVETVNLVSFFAM